MAILRQERLPVVVFDAGLAPRNLTVAARLADERLCAEILNLGACRLGQLP